LAFTALQTAWTGTNAATVALSTAVAGTVVAGAANALANTALQTAWSGTAAAASANSLAATALITAWAGTAAANAVNALASTAVQTSWSGTAAAAAALQTAWSGTATANAAGTLAYTALQTAWSGTAAASIANALAYTALQTAWAGTNAIAAGVTVISTPTTYFVRKDGNDANTGLVNSAGGAFLTIARAMKVVATLVLNSNVTVQVGTGTYTESVNIPSYTGAGSLILQGDTANKDNVIINPTGVAVTCTGQRAFVRFLKLTATSIQVYCENCGWLGINDLTFGACSDSHIHAAHGGVIDVSGANKIIGAAASCYYAYPNGSIYLSGGSLDISTSVAFGNGFASAFYNSLIFVNTAPTFTNAVNATGPRFFSRQNSVIETQSGGGTSFFPGNTAGSTATGGLYL
jgi:hypothetical protein